MARILRKAISAEIISMLLFLIALQALTYGISASLKSTDTEYFFWVCFLAALSAWGLSKRKWNGLHVAVAMAGVGILGVWILGARLAGPLLSLASAVLSAVPQIVPSIRSHLPIDTTSITKTWLVVADASNTLSLRLQTWLFGLNKNVPVNDPLVRNMVWILIMWSLSAWMGWFAGKRNAVAALLPSILLVAAVTSYSERKVEILWLLVLVLFLLMGIWNYKNHTVQWDTRRVDYADSIPYDMGQAALLLTIAVGLIALLTPSVSWRQVRDFLRTQNGRNEVADVLGVEPQRVPPKRAPALKPSLPREHLLSGGFAQSEKIVMTVRTGELPPMSNPSFAAEAPRYYWRSVVYDNYVGAGWVSSSAPSQSYQPNTPLIPGLLNGYKPLHLDVELIQPEGKLFWSGVLFSADIPFRVDWRLRPQSSLFADQSDLLQADMFAALSNARAYRAEAYVSLATVEELRGASTDYPEYIRNRYLSLPSSVPERVHQLAKQITQGKTTAYDKAKAIEAYLRTYPYDLDVPTPPQDQDVADFFLFEQKKGYCDYYATAMVVLARASGIPARFVSGYSPGSYDAANAEYIVRELNAHSWAEVYFPQIGWIEFEPTASQPEIERALSRHAVTPTAEPDSTAARLLKRFRLIKTIYWLSPFAILLIASMIYFTWIERWLYLRLPPAASIEKIYRRLYRLGRPLAGEHTHAETAYEFHRKLISTVHAVSNHARLRKLFSRAEEDIAALTGMYQDTLFTDKHMEKKETRKALARWKHLRLRLLLARLVLAARRRADILHPSNLAASNRRLLRNVRSQ